MILFIVVIKIVMTNIKLNFKTSLTLHDIAKKLIKRKLIKDDELILITQETESADDIIMTLSKSELLEYIVLLSGS